MATKKRNSKKPNAPRAGLQNKANRYSGGGKVTKKTKTK